MNKLHLICIMLLLAGTVIAQQPKAIEIQTGRGTTTIKVYQGVKSTEVYSPEEKRFALVMGVSDYEYLNPLPCIKNDVDTVRRTFQKCGFDVAVALDKTKAEFEAIIDESRQYCIDNGYNIITVYYSGHGAQFGNVQMLAPKDFLFTAKDTSGRLKEFMDNSILLPTIIGKLNIPNAKAVLAISDACRSEDYAKQNTESPIIPSYLITKFTNIQKSLEGTGNVGVLYSSLNGTTSASAPVISLFTQYFVRALGDKPGNFSDLAIRISKGMQDNGENQSPVNTNNPIKYDFKFFRSGQSSQINIGTANIPNVTPSATKGLVFTTEDGYKAIKIGDQIWMAENLNVDHFRDGYKLDKSTNLKEWKDFSPLGGPHSFGYCNPNDDPISGLKYGKLYNLEAIKCPRNLAPQGWHIPSIEEFSKMIDYLGEDSAAFKLKKMGFIQFYPGYRTYYNSGIYNGEFQNFNEEIYFLTNEVTRYDSNGQPAGGIYYRVGKTEKSVKIFYSRATYNEGYSVRCIKD